MTVIASAIPQSMGGIEGQRRAALLRARAELAKNTRVFVNKSLTVYKRSDQQEAMVSQRINLYAVDLQQLKGANIKAEWVNPKSHELFIWYIIPVAQ